MNQQTDRNVPKFCFNLPGYKPCTTMMLGNIVELNLLQHLIVAEQASWLEIHWGFFSILWRALLPPDRPISFCSGRDNAALLVSQLIAHFRENAWCLIPELMMKLLIWHMPKNTCLTAFAIYFKITFFGLMLLLSAKIPDS